MIGTKRIALSESAHSHHSFLKTRPLLTWRVARELYAFRQVDRIQYPDDVPSLLENGIADARGTYDAVEYGLPLLTSEFRSRRINEALTCAQLRTAAVFASVRTDCDLTVLQRIAEQLDYASRILGCKMLTLATIPANPALARSPECERTAEICSQLAVYLKPKGMQVCWHPHQEHMIDNAAGLQEFLHLTRETDVHICLDLGWSHYLGLDSAALVKLCAGRLAGCHIRDSLNGIWQQAVGDGSLDLSSILDAISQATSLSWISVEIWFDRSTPVTRNLRDNALTSARALRGAAGWDLPIGRV